MGELMEIYHFDLFPYRGLSAFPGWPFPNRLFDSATGTQDYAEHIEEAVLCEELGFDGVILNEHHCSAYGLRESPLRAGHEELEALCKRGRAPNQQGAIYLSDGEVNLALVQHGPRLSPERVGINHCGFQIEDMEAFRARMKELGIDQPLERPNMPGSYFEYKMNDPDDNTVDVTEEGWAL